MVMHDERRLEEKDEEGTGMIWIGLAIKLCLSNLA